MRLLAVLASLWSFSAAADPWVFEFEFSYGLPDRLDRLLSPTCSKVVPVEYARWYASDPRPGFEIACGNNQPMFHSFLGRRCWKPLPKLVFHCGYSHFSSPSDNHEITFDALSIRGRFDFGPF